MNNFPQNFRNNPHFAELQMLVETMTNHAAMEVAKPYTLENTIRASTLATSCFYANLVVAQHGVLGEMAKNPFVVQRHTDLLFLLNELSGEELATNNIPTKQGGMSPHFVPMVEAAEEAVISTRGLELQMELLAQGYSMEEACRKAGFRDSVCKYYAVSEWCTQDYMRSLATIALRELTLQGMFKRIAAHLPQRTNLGLYRVFLTSHIELDGGERSGDEMNHGELMVKFLEGVEDVDGMLEVMITFYQARLALYDDCLQPEPLF